ncbi:MAG: Wzz/FepE/Etk N-terminal domain-containing protein [Pseudomonadota bacterium]
MAQRAEAAMAAKAPQFQSVRNNEVPAAEVTTTASKPSAMEQLDLLAQALQDVGEQKRANAARSSQTHDDGNQQQEAPVGDDSQQHVVHGAATPANSAMHHLLSFGSVVGTLIRGWWLIALMGFLGALIAAGYSLTLPNKYESIVEILIEPRGVKVLENSVTPDGLNREATIAYSESQVRIISSSSVIDPVIEDLELYNDPEFNGTAPLPTLFGQFFSFISGPTQTIEESRAAAKKYLYQNFYVLRANQTFTIQIGVTTRDPAKSARVANAIARAYMNDESVARSSAARDANENLTGRLGELSAAVRLSEEKVEAYKAENGLVDTDGKLISEVQLSRLNEQLALAKVQAGDAKTRSEVAQNANLADVLSGSLPSSIASSTISQLRVEYSRAKSQLERLSTRLGERHPERIAAQAELESARDAIAQEIQRIIRSSKEEFKRASARQADLQSQLNTMKSTAVSDSAAKVRLRELNREVEANRRIFESFLLRSRETGEQGKVSTNSARIISEAVPSSEKSGPNRKLIVLIGSILGAGLGVFLVIIPLMIAVLRLAGKGAQEIFDPSGLHAATPSVSPDNDDLYGTTPIDLPASQAASTQQQPVSQRLRGAPFGGASGSQAAQQMNLPGMAPAHAASMATEVPHAAPASQVPIQPVMQPVYGQPMQHFAPQPMPVHPGYYAPAMPPMMQQPMPVPMMYAPWVPQPAVAEPKKEEG